MLKLRLVVPFVVGAVGLAAWALWPERESARRPSPTITAAIAETYVSAVEPVAAAVLRTEAIVLRARDTLLAALMRADIPSATAHGLAAALREAGVDLRKLRPGHALELARDAENNPVTLTLAPTPWERFEARSSDRGWAVERREITPDLRIEVRQGDVRHSLWDAVESGAVSPQLLLDMAHLFESEFDFSADTQSGDRFRMLVESKYANGKFVEHGRILAAQYQSGNQLLTGVAFEHDGKLAHYDAEGRSLKKMFLRSPLQFTRISSGYTHRRPHPVLGGVRPHLAIDYAAPTGTPVWAVADGVVEFAGRKGGNGIQVLLRHRAGYRTYYNHLSKIGKGVRPGVKVKQKQVIGYVGSTGLSTGPHLDYRVNKNGTFVNPLSEKFLPGDPVPAAQRATFLTQAQDHLARLEREVPFAQTPAVVQ